VQDGRTPRTGVCHVCRCVSTKPGITIMSVASTISASSTERPRPTSTIAPSSARTSPFATSPTSGSIETTKPLRMNSRCELMSLSFAGRSPTVRQSRPPSPRENASRAAGCTASINTSWRARQPPSMSVFPDAVRVPAASRSSRSPSSAAACKSVRSVTVDTLRRTCTQWSPGRGTFLGVLPSGIRLLVSAAGHSSRGGAARVEGRVGQLTASAVVAARFLPIWLATGALIVVAAAIAPNAIKSTSWAFVLPYMTILAIAALGQMLVIMHAGIDLSTPGVISLGGNLLVGVSSGSNDRLALGILACVGLGVLVGLVNGVLVGILRLNPLIVALAVGKIVLAVAMRYSREVTGQSAVPSSLSSWASEKPLGISSVFWAGAALTLAVAFVLRYTAPARRFQPGGAYPRRGSTAG